MAKLTNELPQTFTFDNKQVWISDNTNTELINFEDIRKYLNKPMIGTIEKFAGRADIFNEGGIEYRILKPEVLDNSNNNYDDLLAIWGTLELKPSFINKVVYFDNPTSAFSKYNNGNVTKHVHGLSVGYLSQPQIRKRAPKGNFSGTINLVIPDNTIGAPKTELIVEQGLFFDNAKTTGQTGSSADYTCGENISCKYYYAARLV
jgi:hypothetical protein